MSTDNQKSSKSVLLVSATALVSALLLTACGSSDHEEVKAVDKVEEASEMAKANAPEAEVLDLEVTETPTDGATETDTTVEAGTDADTATSTDADTNADSSMLDDAVTSEGVDAESADAETDADGTEAAESESIEATTDAE